MERRLRPSSVGITCAICSAWPRAARAFPLSDGAPATTAALAHGPGWDDLADVDFRVGRSPARYTVAGEDYFLQYMPVGMRSWRGSGRVMLAR